MVFSASDAGRTVQVGGLRIQTMSERLLRRNQIRWRTLAAAQRRKEPIQILLAKFEARGGEQDPAVERVRGESVSERPVDDLGRRDPPG